MNVIVRTFAWLPIMACMSIPQAGAQAVTEIGGQKIVTLKRAAVSKTSPEFTSVTLAPGRGMELIQITANFPGKGSVDVLASPSLAEAKDMLDDCGHSPHRDQIGRTVEAIGRFIVEECRKI